MSEPYLQVPCEVRLALVGTPPPHPTVPLVGASGPGDSEGAVALGGFFSGHHGSWNNFRPGGLGCCLPHASLTAGGLGETPEAQTFITA